MYMKLCKLHCILTLVFISVIDSVQAQQAEHFSHYMLNKYGQNVAYAGFDYSLSGTGIYRNQWSEFNGSPVGQYINAHMPLYFLHGAGGFEIMNEQLGLESRQSFTLSYSYVHRTRIGLFATGLKLGIRQIRIANDKLVAPDGNYEGNIIQHNDPVLSNQIVRGLGSRYGIAFYFINDLFEIGFSMDDFLNQSVHLGESRFNIPSSMTFFAEANYSVFQDFELKPSIMLYSDWVEWQSVSSILLSLPQNFFGGIGIRGYNLKSLDAAIITVGWKFNEKYIVSYAYDFGLSTLRSAHSGSSEIVLKYNLNKKIGLGLLPRIIYNPRDL